MVENFHEMLVGGHPNSLGRTIEVVDQVVSQPDRIEELFQCYKSDDAVVRMRTSNALKRAEKERHDLLVPYINRLVSDIGELDQASAQWTLAQLFDRLYDDMDGEQRSKALDILKRNLAHHNDWIVLNMTIETLTNWASDNARLQSWLKPHLERLARDNRQSVSKRAQRSLDKLLAWS